MIDEKFLFLAAVFFVSNVVEAVTGFGATIIALTLGALVFPINELVTVLIPCNIALSAWIVGRHHRDVDKPALFGAILPFAMIGLLAGAAIFTFVEGPALRLAYGAFVLCFSVFELQRLLHNSGKERKPLSKIASAAWLMSGGLVQGIYASGGPLVVYYASRKLNDKRSFRSTLSSLWLTLNAVLITVHAVTGKVTADSLRASAALVPSLLLGIVAGEIIHNRIPERGFRIFVFSLLILAGLALLAKG